MLSCEVWVCFFFVVVVVVVVVESSSPSLHFLVLQGTMRVSKHSNEAIVMTDASSSKDSGDDAQQTNNRHMELSKCF